MEILKEELKYQRSENAKGNKSVVVNLPTQTAFLLSVETPFLKSDDIDGYLAVEIAVKTALEMNLNFDYINENDSKEKLELEKFYKNELKDYLKDNPDSDIFEYLDYVYFDLSEHNLDNVYVNFNNLTIDDEIYDNTYMREDYLSFLEKKLEEERER